MIIPHLNKVEMVVEQRVPAVGTAVAVVRLQLLLMLVQEVHKLEEVLEVFVLIMVQVALEVMLVPLNSVVVAVVVILVVVVETMVVVAAEAVLLEDWQQLQLMQLELIQVMD